MVLRKPQIQETLEPGANEKPQQPKPKSAPEKRDLETVIENMTKERDEKVMLIRETFNERIAKSSNKISERAIGAWENMRNKQINGIYNFYNSKIEEFKTKAMQGWQDREALATQLMEEARQKADTRKLLLTMLIDSKKKGESVTTKEVAEIDKAASGLMEFEKTHAHLEPLITKMAKKEKPLEKSDYEAVVAILSPHDIAKEGATSAAAFEATAAGILVGAMSPEQRGELIKVFMSGNRRSETPALMDAFLGMDIITYAQARELLKGTAFEEKITKKIDSGKYNGQRADLAKQREKDTAKYSGIYNQNVVSRFIGKPLLGLVAMVWGVATMGVNFLMARKKGEKGTTLKALGRSLKNPRFLGGAAAAGVGLEIAGTGMKTDAGWFGGGAISRGLDKVGESTKEENTPESKAKNFIQEIKEKGSKALKAYITNGGYTSMKNLRTEIIRERSEHKNPRKISLEELIKTEKDPNQKARLQAMLSLSPAERHSINLDIEKVAEAGSILKIKTNDQFLKAYNSESNEAKEKGDVAANNPQKPHATI